MKHSTIRVTLDNIDYDQICQYYNTEKQPEWNPIQKLHSLEGGFYIDRTDQEIEAHNRFITNSNMHGRIKQLRWNKKRLVTPISFYGFSIDEKILLYNALSEIHGSENVFLENVW
jgi:hypothetical protein